MTHRRCSLGLIVGVLASIAGCGSPAEPPPSPPAALVEVHPAESRTLHEELTAYGTTEFAASALTQLVVQYEARVVKVLVVSGESVRQGQALVELAASAVSQLELDKARRDAVVASAEHERVVRFRNTGLATESELQTAANTATTAQELRDSLIARIGPSGVRMLVAPQSGIVDALTAQPGNILAPGTVVARVAQPDGLMMRLGIEPGEVTRLTIGQAVRLVPLEKTVTEVTTRIASIDRRVDPQSRLAGATINLPRNSGLLPGSAARANILLAAHDNAVSIPTKAVLYSSDQAYVFVAHDKVAQRRSIRVGVQENGFLEVVEGLKIGEPVIVSGNYELEDGMAIRSAQGSPP